MKQFIIVLLFAFVKMGFAQDTLVPLYMQSQQEREASLNSQKTISKKKGFFIGANFAIGNGTVQNDVLGWFDFNMATIFRGDLGYYFNSVIGFKTGVSYISLPYGKQNEYTTSLLGIPTLLVISVGEKVGFYAETGPVFYFESDNSNPIVAAENMLGFHITAGNVDFKLGMLLNFTFIEKPNKYEAGSIFTGLNAGIGINL